MKHFKIQTDLKLVESEMVKYCDMSAESTKNQQLPIFFSHSTFIFLLMLTVNGPPQGHLDVDVNLFLLLNPLLITDDLSDPQKRSAVERIYTAQKN